MFHSAHVLRRNRVTKELDGRESGVGLMPQFAFKQWIQEMPCYMARDHLCSIRGGISIGYPSKKMGDIIRAESRMVEFSICPGAGAL